MKEPFGQYLRAVREKNEMPLRKLAALLDIDQSTLSKVERGERYIPRELITEVANIFNCSPHDLLVRYLSDKIVYPLLAEEIQEEVLLVAQEKLKYLKSKQYKQGELNI